MSKRKKISFSNTHTTLDEVEYYYVDSEESLNSFFNSSVSLNKISARFIGYSKVEIDDELKTRKHTLDRMCSLEILAAIEAWLRIDYLVRCQNKMRDDFSRKLREIHNKKEDRARLIDDIVSTWKAQHPEHKARLDNLGKALDYRNWLAHGRYWLPKKTPHVHSYDYLSVYTLASDILANMELVESA